jgi:hypothetical protein
LYCVDQSIHFQLLSRLELSSNLHQYTLLERYPLLYKPINIKTMSIPLSKRRQLHKLAKPSHLPSNSCFILICRFCIFFLYTWPRGLFWSTRRREVTWTNHSYNTTIARCP